VAYVHERGVLHRDIKPSNVLLQPPPGRADTEAGATHLPLDALVPKLTDFGLAKLTAAEPDLTDSRALLGTPLYMAPEQVVAGQQPITPATDIYALGIVMYELVTGELPFKGNSITVMALKRVREAPASPRSVRPNLDPRWEAVILRCLEREPARRYQRGPALIAALTGTETPAPLPPTAEPPASGGKLRSFIRRATGRYRQR
jgi:serine/threonine protein kinase